MMKKLFVILLFIGFLLLSCITQPVKQPSTPPDLGRLQDLAETGQVKKWRLARSYIGGGEGAIDKIDGVSLQDDERLLLITSYGVTSGYRLDASSGMSEDTTNYSVIAPDSNAGAKRWILMWSSGRILIPDATVDQGDNAVVGSLAWHIVDAAGNPTTVTVLPGTYTVSQNVTVPSTMTLRIVHGGQLVDDASDATLTINGKLEAGTHQIFDFTTGTGTVVMQAGIVRNPYWWGENATALEDALNSMVTKSKMVIPPGVYGPIASSIEADVPQHCTIEAWGAELEFTTDAAGIDMNTSLTTEVRNVRWLGGKFLNSAGTKVNSTGIEAREFRLFEVRGVHFEGFGKAIYAEDRDTLIIHNNYFYDNDYSVYGDESAGGNDVGLFITSIKNNHFSINGESAGIYLKGAVAVLEIIGNSFNGNVGTAIFIDNSTADAPAFDMRSYAIKGNHFEQGGAATKYIHFNDVSSRTFYSLDITGNDFTTATADAIVLERCHGVNIDANLFGQTTGNGTPIDLDANCTDVRIGRSNSFSTGPIVFACDRKEITFGEEYVNVPYETLTGYGNNSFATGVATLDMSTILPNNFPTLAGMKPKAWVINITAKDDDSAASVLALVELATDNTITVGSRSRLSLAGVPDDVYRSMTAIVPCDANGDIWLNIVVTTDSPESLQLYLVVVGYYM